MKKLLLLLFTLTVGGAIGWSVGGRTLCSFQFPPGPVGLFTDLNGTKRIVGSVGVTHDGTEYYLQAAAGTPLWSTDEDLLVESSSPADCDQAEPEPKIIARLLDLAAEKRDEWTNPEFLRMGVFDPRIFDLLDLEWTYHRFELRKAQYVDGVLRIGDVIGYLEVASSENTYEKHTLYSRGRKLGRLPHTVVLRPTAQIPGSYRAEDPRGFFGYRLKIPSPR